MKVFHDSVSDTKTRIKQAVCVRCLDNFFYMPTAHIMGSPVGKIKVKLSLCFFLTGHDIKAYWGVEV
jgi:hypothetical protein